MAVFLSPFISTIRAPVSGPWVQEAECSKGDDREDGDQHGTFDRDTVRVATLGTRSDSLSFFFGLNTAVFCQDFGCTLCISFRNQDLDAPDGIGQERIRRDGHFAIQF